MHIDIALRFKPFSHSPGTICLIPGTLWRVQVFPTLMRFFGPQGEESTYTFSHQGPLEEFTVEQDLEKGHVRVVGKTAGRFLSILVRCHEGGLELMEGKQAPVQVVSMVFCKQADSLFRQRLSLGFHKKQEWEGIKRRRELGEILPLWFYLGNMTPFVTNGTKRTGNLLLLDECKHLAETSQRYKLDTHLRHLFLAGFEGLFNPRIHDSDHQGILSDVPCEDPQTALLLLSEGAKLIKDLFISFEKEKLVLLPCLLSCFHAGRFVNLVTSEKDRVDLEWSKGLLRRVIIHPCIDRTVSLEWPKELRHCRLRSSLQDRGRPLKKGDRLDLRSNQPLFLDCFEK